MKPITKEENKVYNLHKKISPLKQEAFEYAKEHCFYKLGTIKYKSNLCLECGHKYKEDKLHVKTSKCPSCKNNLRIIEFKGRWANDTNWLTIIDSYKGYQVIRYIQISKYWGKGQAVDSFYFECMQKWISPKGKMTVLSTTITGGMGSFVISKFVFSKKFEVYKNTGTRNNIQSVLYPKRRGSATSKRNGYKYSIHNCKADDFFIKILTRSTAETLLKTKQYSALEQYVKVNKLSYSKLDVWKSIKICIRNNYIIKDYTTWLDMLSILHKLNRDIKNPKFICPQDLHKEHQRLLKIQKEKRRKEKYQKLIKQIREDSIEYNERLNPYLDLEFKENDIHITPVYNVKQLYEDSHDLNHCAFESEYHKKENVILLRALVKGELLETIEYSLSQQRILQSRGYNNKATKYNKKIKAVINKKSYLIDEITNKLMKNKSENKKAA